VRTLSPASTQQKLHQLVSGQRRMNQRSVYLDPPGGYGNGKHFQYFPLNNAIILFSAPPQAPAPQTAIGTLPPQDQNLRTAFENLPAQGTQAVSGGAPSQDPNLRTAFENLPAPGTTTAISVLPPPAQQTVDSRKFFIPPLAYCLHSLFYLSLGVIYFQASLKLSPRRPSTSLSVAPLPTTINRPTLRLRLKLSPRRPSTALSVAPRDLEEVHPSSSSNPPSRLRQPVKPTARRLEVSTSTEGRPAPHHR
jgi:hypothetical protein